VVLIVRRFFVLLPCATTLKDVVRFWHLSDIPPAPMNVRYQG
jgi:hypothetical protein